MIRKKILPYILRALGSLILFFHFSLLAQNTNLLQPKRILVDDLEFDRGISKSEQTKIRNHIYLSLYEHFHEKYIVVDDGFLAEYFGLYKKKANECKKDKCREFIQTEFLPEESIRGKISKKNKTYSFEMDLFSHKENRNIHTEETSFSEENFDHELSVFIVKLLNTEADSNIRVQPKFDIKPDDAIDFTPIENKDLEGIDITVEKFSTSSKEGEQTVKKILKNVDNGDKLFKRKNYTKALEEFEEALRLINESQELGSQSPSGFLSMSIRNRVVNTLYNVTLEEIHKLDKKIPSNKKYSIKNIEENLDAYESLRIRVLQTDSASLRNISLGLEERIEKLDAILFSLYEAEGRDYLETLEFQKAYDTYEKIYNHFLKKPGEGMNKYFLTRSKELLQLSQRLGRAQNTDRVVLHCDSAILRYHELNYSRSINDTKMILEQESSLESSLGLAASYLQKTDFIESNATETYSYTIKLINIQNTQQVIVPNIPREPSRPASTGEGINFERHWKTLIFPGAWHMTVAKDEWKSRTLFYGGWLGLFYAAGRGIDYSNALRNANRFERISPLFYYYSPAFHRVLTMNDADTASNLQSRLETSRAQFGYSIGFLSALYAISIFDSYIFMPEKKSSLISYFNPISGDGFQISGFPSPVSPAIGVSRGTELYTKFSYSWRF